MKDYMKPCIRENDPDHLIFHVGTNDVPSIKKECVILFDNKYYNQIDVVAMVSPLG